MIWMTERGNFVRNLLLFVLIWDFSYKYVLLQATIRYVFLTLPSQT